MVNHVRKEWRLALGHPDGNYVATNSPRTRERRSRLVEPAAHCVGATFKRRLAAIRKVRGPLRRKTLSR